MLKMQIESVDKLEQTLFKFSEIPIGRAYRAATSHVRVKVGNASAIDFSLTGLPRCFTAGDHSEEAVYTLLPPQRITIETD